MGTSLMDFSFEMVQLAVQLGTTLIIFENPEDLRAMQSGPYAGPRLASMWQSQEFHTLISQEQIETAAFYQQDFGTLYLKPTRLLLKAFTKHTCYAYGTPCFDEQGFYEGPLQSREVTQHLIGHAGASFNTHRAMAFRFLSLGSRQRFSAVYKCNIKHLRRANRRGCCCCI